jgi:hypothetical protein
VDGGESNRVGRDGCRAWAWIRGRFGPDLGREGRRFPSRRGWRLCQRAREAAATAVVAEVMVAGSTGHGGGQGGAGCALVSAAVEDSRGGRCSACRVRVSGRGGMFSDCLLRRVAGRGGRRERNGAVGRAGVASSRPTRGRGRWVFCSKSELAWMMFEVVTAFPVPVTLAGLSLVVFPAVGSSWPACGQWG